MIVADCVPVKTGTSCIQTVASQPTEIPACAGTQEAA